MKNRSKIAIVAAVFIIAGLFAGVPHPRPAAFDHLSHEFDDALVMNAEAQTPPIPSAIAVAAVATTTGAGAMDMLSAPTGQNRNYVYQAICVNTSAATQMVASIKDGSTTLAYVSCPPAAAAVAVNFNPPLRQPTAATKLTMTASTATTTAYFYMSGFTAR